MGSTPLAHWCTATTALVLALVVGTAMTAPATVVGSPVGDSATATNEIEVPVECGPSNEDADAVLCRVVGETGRSSGTSRGARRLLGFLTGLHLGGAISSSGSLSASHSLNVFGKVMNTALSVSYGPNGYYQVPGAVGGRPPLSPIGPGFGGLADDPNAPSSPPASSLATSSSTSSSSTSSVSSAAATSPDKGGEASAVLAGTITRDATKTAATQSGHAPGIARVELQAPAGESQPQNRLTVAEDIGGEDAVADANRVKVIVEAPAGASVVTVSKDNRLEDVKPAPVHESTDEDEAVGEEPLPEPGPPAASGVQLSSQRRAELEAVARVRTPSADNQRRLFLQHHNQHVAAFNRHFAKYNGDVSRVAVFSRAA